MTETKPNKKWRERSLKEKVKELVEDHRRALDARAAVLKQLNITSIKLFKVYLEWRNKNKIRGGIWTILDSLFFSAVEITDNRVRRSLILRFQSLDVRVGGLTREIIDDETLRAAVDKLNKMLEVKEGK